MIAIPLMTALLLTAGIPEPTLGRTGERTSVMAESGEFRRADGKVHVEGGAVVNSGDVWIRADEVDFDVKSKEVRARGSLVIVDGNVVVTGDEGSMTVGDPDSLNVQGASLFQKEKKVSGEDLDRLSEARRARNAAAQQQPEGVEEAAKKAGPNSDLGEKSPAEEGDEVSADASGENFPAPPSAASDSSAAAASGSESGNADASTSGGGSGKNGEAKEPEEKEKKNASLESSGESGSEAEKTESADAASGKGAESGSYGAGDSSNASAAGEDAGGASQPPAETEDEKRIFQQSEAMAGFDRAEFGALGKNALIIQAGEISRSGGAYQAKDLRLTSCDCKDTSCPAWSLGARSADITPGDGAWLYWPTFRINDVPVLGFPIFYVPLSPRRTGFLFPKIEFSSSGGFGADIPFFLTLGRSYDLTFTAGFLTKPLLALSSQNVQRESAWGPRGSIEFRYAPHKSTRGSIKISGILDQGFDTLDGERERRGFRGQLTWRHRSSFENGLGFYADLAGLTDARYLSDISNNLLAGATTYLPSSARMFWRTNDFELTLSSQWFQDLATARSDFFPDDDPLIGSDSPASYQRPAVFSAQMPLKRIAGPLHFGGEIIGLHSRPIGFGGGITRERLKASMRQDQLSDFYALTRLDIAPKFWIPVSLFGPIRGELTAAARGDFSAYTPVISSDGIGRNDSTSAFWGRAYADARIWTELSRVFGQGGGALRHAITPSFQIRASTREFGSRDDFDLTDEINASEAVIPLDELDATNRAASPRLFQGVAALRSRLSRSDGTGAFTLTLGQGFDFTRMDFGETFVEATTAFRWFSAGAGLRYDPELKDISMVQGRLRLSDPRGDYFSAAYDFMRGSGTSLMRQGLDDLIGEQANRALDDVFQQINLGVGITIVPQFAVSYGIRIAPNEPKGDRILLHTAALRFLGKCDCWSFDLGAQWAPVTERWSATFMVTLKNLGSFGNN